MAVAVPRADLWNESCTAVACCAASCEPAVDATFDTRTLKAEMRNAEMAKATLTISSKNYSSWCLRGWLLCKLAGLEFDEEVVSLDDPWRARRAAAAVALVPGAVPDRTTGSRSGTRWRSPNTWPRPSPKPGLLPADRAARAHCRAICGEMHSGFYNLRSALPMNLKAHHPGFKVWAGAQADIERVVAIWRECLATYGGPYLFGERSPWPMPCTRRCARASSPTMSSSIASAPPTAAPSWTGRPWREWVADAKAEPAELEELDMEF